ncbi:MAG TPA: Gfo/Idh/MocA family oxidoreductase [Lacipirellulaceae bacterium]|nr:Gfo/Idh/MocA family oxidoreductase [Lacipirellulaceae bacterium]
MAHIDRRDFLRASAVGASYLAMGRAAGAKDVNGKLRYAAIGNGGKGRDDLEQISASPRVEVVALCDVDSTQEHLGWAAEKFPKAMRFSDYRRLMDKASMFDAVSVSTPDHMHAPITMAAIGLGKHVFCQKPLTHSVREARLVTEAAKRHGVVTQMGNQIQSHHAYRMGVKLIHDGAIGKVKEVHSWQAGKMEWLFTDRRPASSDPVPKTLNWNVWLGVAPERPYKKGYYHPWNWRGWQDFGSGQLGDFGCHILDPVFMALDLTAPRTVEADSPGLNNEVWAKHSKVEYQFPGTGRTAGDEITVTWYDGRGHKPKREGLGLPEFVEVPEAAKKGSRTGTKKVKYELPGAGSAFVGEKGTMVLPHWSEPLLFPQEKFADYKMPVMQDLNHYTSWAHACLDHGTTTSNFGYAGPLSETVLLGTIAIRFPKEQLLWDSEALEFTHHADATARLTSHYRKGWELPKA